MLAWIFVAFAGFFVLEERLGAMLAFRDVHSDRGSA